MEPAVREFGKRVAGRGRHVYVAGALALTEPGPAAAGIVVADEQGRMLAQRAHYLGNTTRREATADALLAAARLAAASGLEAPVFRIDDAWLSDALAGRAEGDERLRAALVDLRAALDQLPGHRVEVVPATTNRARTVALTPLVDWLPERTRRAEAIRVRPLGGGEYEVESETQPGQVYRVTLRADDGAAGTSGGVTMQCECADFQYRGIPCKHLLAVAREAGAMERLFYP